MFKAALMFLMLSFVSALAGAYGIAGISMDLSKMLFVIFLLLAATSLIGGIFYGSYIQGV